MEDYRNPSGSRQVTLQIWLFGSIPGNHSKTPGNVLIPQMRIGLSALHPQRQKYHYTEYEESDG
jgi:hypothetical protein